jgi:hypothetical protein
MWWQLHGLPFSALARVRVADINVRWTASIGPGKRSDSRPQTTSIETTISGDATKGNRDEPFLDLLRTL